MPKTSAASHLIDTALSHPRAVVAWRVGLAALLVVVLYLALSPAPPKVADFGWDKLNHFAAFATLTLVAWLGFARAGWRIPAGMLAYGALIEVLQSMTPTRSAEWGDLLADSVGIGIGLLLAAAVVRLRPRRGLESPAAPAP